MIWGLPNDQLSVENGVLTTRSQRWPLMIDPQGQANHWIRNMQAENNLKVLKMGQDKYLQQIENAMRIGQVSFPFLSSPSCLLACHVAQHKCSSTKVHTRARLL